MFSIFHFIVETYVKKAFITVRKFDFTLFFRLYNLKTLLHNLKPKRKINEKSNFIPLLSQFPHIHSSTNVILKPYGVCFDSVTNISSIEYLGCKISWTTGHIMLT